jgi:hypothetical protein
MSGTNEAIIVTMLWLFQPTQSELPMQHCTQNNCINIMPSVTYEVRGACEKQHDVNTHDFYQCVKALSGE